MSRSRLCLTPLRPRTTTMTKTFHRHRAGGEPGNEGNDTCDNSYLLLWFLALVSSVVYYITQTRGMSLLVVHLNIFSPLVVPCIGYHWAVLIVSQWFSWQLHKKRISFVCLFPCIVCCCIISAVSLPSAPPIIFVVIGLIIALDEYVVYVRNDAGEILTDSAGNSIISLWVLIQFGTNVLHMNDTVHRLCNWRAGGHCPTKQESTAVAIVFKATQSLRICYLPTISISTHLEANSSWSVYFIALHVCLYILG